MHPNQETFDHHYAPSFNSYSTNNLAQIAARVTDELSMPPDNHTSRLRQNLFAGSDDVEVENNIDDDVDDDFEFDLVNKASTDSEIGPVYPVFDLELLKEFDNSKPVDVELEEQRVMVPLKKLFIQDDDDREPPCSSSSSEAGELEGVPPESYCVWTPAKARPPSSSQSPSRCMKSNSTGSTSKPWKFRDLLLKRSKSDGREGVVLLTPRKKKGEERKEKTDQKTKPKDAPTTAAAATARDAAREVFHGRNKERDSIKRKSYLPYKRDLVGFFIAPQGLRVMNFRPF